MEAIPNDPYLKFNPDALQEVRKEINLHQAGAMDDLIRNFKEWIEKQSHFVKKDFTEHFLEASIVLGKGSLERTKRNLDKLCTFKTLTPKFFEKHNPKNELMDLSTFMIQCVLPQPTKENYRVFFQKVLTADFTSKMLDDYFRFFVLICEYMKAHDYTHGMVVVLDTRGINLVNFALNLNAIEFRHIMTMTMEGYGFRLKGIHIISESKAVDAVVSVIKQVTSAKVGSRIQVHKTEEAVHEYVPKEIMPADYGGKEKPIKELYKEMVELFSTEKNVEYFKDVCQPGTDEAYRHAAKFNEEILGMPGSFRRLTVD